MRAIEPPADVCAQIVPVGQRYDITWNSTSPYSGGTVSLYLCKGPSTNCVTVGTIASGTPNDGVYEWTPSTSLADSNGDTGYGMKIVIDSNGAYQWSTQFGISNKNSGSSSSSSAAATSASVKVDSVSTSSSVVSASSVPAKSSSTEKVVTETLTEFTTYCPEATTFAHGSKTYTVTGASSVSLDCGNGACVVTRPVYTSTVTSCKDCATATPILSTPTPIVSLATSTKVAGVTTAVTTAPAAVVPSAGSPQGTPVTTPGRVSTPVAGTPVTTPGAHYTGAATAVKAGGFVGMVAGMAGAFFAL
ncbi:Ser-Thr-rich glycosyl-phosphatidyl-inositol-anchored membrane family-domain-containing protein [Phyllosticta capitalensis]|uniref:Ser-Thr-rich glycosyl-phosphatidyl-inositol-anchored membrane family-domain-containing protein n=1 Tax=Phyllosticta capitalensis TaxID=121624 RepID=A0ABR1YXC9_9PEZI